MTGWSGTVLNVRARDSGFADECVPREHDRDAVALEHDLEVGERFTAVADEVRGTFEGDGEDRGDRPGRPDQRRGGTPRRV